MIIPHSVVAVVRQ